MRRHGLTRRPGESKKKQLGRIASRVGLCTLALCCSPCICCAFPFLWFSRSCTPRPCERRSYHCHSSKVWYSWIKKYGGVTTPMPGFKPQQQLPRRNLSEESLDLQPTTSSSFLRLPLEIRMLVYKALPGAKRIGALDNSYSWVDTSLYAYPVDRANSMNILRVCKQIYQEAISVVYQETKFVVLHEVGFTEFINFIPIHRFRDIRELVVTPDMIQEPFCQFIGQRLDVDKLRLEVMLSSDSLYPETRWLRQLETMPYCGRLNLELLIDTNGASVGIRQEAAEFMKIVTTRLHCQPKLTWFRVPWWSDENHHWQFSFVNSSLASYYGR